MDKLEQIEVSRLELNTWFKLYQRKNSPYFFAREIHCILKGKQILIIVDMGCRQILLPHTAPVFIEMYRGQVCSRTRYTYPACQQFIPDDLPF